MKKTTAILVGLVLSIPLAIFGFFAYQNVSTRASDSIPRDVVASKVTDTSALISWYTDQPTEGAVMYGTSPKSMVFLAPEAQMSNQHEVELSLLSPKTDHYYVIQIGDKIYDSTGAVDNADASSTVPWEFTTKASGSGEGSNDEEKSNTPEVEDLPSDDSSQEDEDDATVGDKEDKDDSSGPTVTGSMKNEPTPTCEEETDCTKVLQRLQRDCETTDYVRCSKANSATPTFTPVPPTSTPEPEEDSEEEDEENEGDEDPTPSEDDEEKKDDEEDPTPTPEEDE